MNNDVVLLNKTRMLPELDRRIARHKLEYGVTPHTLALTPEEFAHFSAEVKPNLILGHQGMQLEWGLKDLRYCGVLIACLRPQV